MPARTSDAEIQRVFELRARGFTQRAIAREMDLSERTIRRIDHRELRPNGRISSSTIRRALHACAEALEEPLGVRLPDDDALARYEALRRNRNPLDED